MAQWDSTGLPHALGQHPGLLQHALRGGRRPRDLGEPDQGHPGRVRRRVRRQDPRPLRADHGHPGPRRRPARALRDDPARGAGGRHAGAPGHHPAEDRRQARRHADGARGRDDHRVGRLLRRRAHGQRRLPGQPLQVAQLRGARLRGAHPQAEHRRVPRPDGAPDDLRHRLAHGADGAGARASIRSSSGCATSCARATRWPTASPGRATAPGEVLRRLAEHPLWKNRAEWAATSGKDGHGLRGTGLAARRLARRPPADRRHGAAQSGRHAQRAHRPGRHRRHQHRAGPDRRHGVRRRHRQGQHHHGRHRRRADDRAQRGQQDHLHGGRGRDAGRAGRPPPDARDRRGRAGGVDPRPRDRGRQGVRPRRARPGRDPGPDRQEGQPLHVQGPAGPRREPARPSLSRRPRSRPSSPGSRSIPTPAS